MNFEIKMLYLFGSRVVVFVKTNSVKLRWEISSVAVTINSVIQHVNMVRVIMHCV